MAIKIDLPKEKYVTLISVIEFFKNCASDISIVQGKILNYDDRKTTLYDIDLTDLMGANDVYLNNLKNKFDLMEIFKRQNCDCTIEITDKKYIIGDKFSKVEFQSADPRNLYNKPVKESASNVVATKNIDKDNSVFKYEFGQLLLERIKGLSKSLETHQMNITLQNGRATFSLIMGDTNKSVMTKIVEIDNIDYDGNDGNIQLPVNPFLLNGIQTISAGLYPNFTKNNEFQQMTLVLESSIGVDPIIKVKTYSTNSLIERT